jgi:hypothetical protein
MSRFRRDRCEYSRRGRRCQGLAHAAADGGPVIRPVQAITAGSIVWDREVAEVRDKTYRDQFVPSVPGRSRLRAQIYHYA